MVHKLYGQRWAKSMIDLLVAANRDVADGPPSDDRMAQINADYTALLRRLRKHREDVLRFLSDPEVPFTNNIAEQAVRMPKVKQKISGCFRTFEGAGAFCTIRSYLETLRKQGVDLLHALVQSFQGEIPQPAME